MSLNVHSQSSRFGHWVAHSIRMWRLLLHDFVLAVSIPAISLCTRSVAKKRTVWTAVGSWEEADLQLQTYVGGREEGGRIRGNDTTALWLTGCDFSSRFARKRPDHVLPAVEVSPHLVILCRDDMKYTPLETHNQTIWSQALPSTSQYFL